MLLLSFMILLIICFFFQQYPDTLMPRLACALARLLTKDPLSPTNSTPGSPAPRKLSLKSKPTWRSASAHGDNRSQAFKCPFTATNALTAATKKEIDAYTSSEEIRSGSRSAISSEKINEPQKSGSVSCVNIRDRRSLGIHLEHSIYKEEKESSDEENTPEAKSSESVEKVEETLSTSAASTSKPNLNSALRKTSCTVALDIYRRRGSGVPVRSRLNSLNVVQLDRLNELKEKFGTPEKVMHFFGRCFVKFFSNYGYAVTKILFHYIFPYKNFTFL